jgi:DNA topoisomerase-2
MPSYDPREIADNILKKLNGESFSKMAPFYKGFQGDIKPKLDNSANYMTKGVFQLDDLECTIEITELPVDKWTRDYKDFLEKLIEQGEFHDIREQHTTNRVHFSLIFS